MSVNIKINGRPCLAKPGQTILQAAAENNIKIPTLCYLYDSATGVNHAPASCRVCVVEIAGRRNLAPACVTTVTEGLEIITNSQRARDARKNNLDLLLSDHPQDCLVCDKSGKCELQNLAAEFGIRDITYKGKMSKENSCVVSTSLKRNSSKCILCGRCVEVCKKVQSVSVISATKRGFHTTITSEFDYNADQTNCINCGQCVKVCPTGALMQTDQSEELLKVLNDKAKYVVVHTAPGTRIALGDEFGHEIGTNVQGKMIAALKTLGFKKVFDTNFGADLTIMEEGTEFLNRFTKKEKLPLMTSCCPGWVKFVEHNYPDLLDNLSTCKSPQNMTGALIKSYFAQKEGLDPKDIYVVSIMPCIAKKFESGREELNVNGLQDNDLAISVKELAVVIKKAGINFNELDDANYDSLLGASTGAADIFANTGGVIEAVVRNAAYLLDNKTTDVDVVPLRGETGVREAEVTAGGHKIRLAVVSGLANARKVLDNIKAGTVSYDAIEVMACPGGCVNGGGQPEHLDVTTEEILKKRHEGIYDLDKNKEKRISALNPEVQTLYKDFLKEPNSHLAHELLHTHYKKR